MTIQSQSTLHHLERIAHIQGVMLKLNDLHLDIVDVNYDTKQIIIDTPPRDMPIKNLWPISSCDKRSSCAKINGIHVVWASVPTVKEVRYGNA